MKGEYNSFSQNKGANKTLERKLVLFYSCNVWGKILKQILQEEYDVLSTNRPEEINRSYKGIEFIFSECKGRCSIDCKEQFFISKALKTPLCIVRGRESKKVASTFLCMFFHHRPLSSSQEKIIKAIKESKFYVDLNRLDYSKPLIHQIEFVKKFIVEKEPKILIVKNVSEEIHISRSYLSTLFREATGIILKEFIVQLKTCHLFNLISSKEPLWRISKLLGYRDPGTFSKIFKRMLKVRLCELRKEKD